MPYPYDNERFQPPPPIRTGTNFSQKSQSSGFASPDTLSPTSTHSRGPLSPTSPTSPTEASFFGAISTRMRGRSRSRSRGGSSRKRSKSPMTMPPEQFPHMSTSTPVYAPRRPQQSRHVSAPVPAPSSSPAARKPTRPTMPTAPRRSSEKSDMWRGRHSNSWLFNDFSVTETASRIFRKS